MNESEILFSVIIPIYNTERYLRECIDSVLDQSIGLEHLQIILVNNASEDGSDTVCKQYLDAYPEQILYIVLEENIGPSKPRNIGISYAQGRYIVFLDSDDKFERNAFRNAYTFFEKHYDEIDVVACRIQNFEAYGGWHALDYVFSSDRVVNIHDEYHCITSVIHAFFKRTAIQGRSLDVSVTYCEDTKFVNEIILEKGAYGVLRSAVYLYRRRHNQTSAIQIGREDPRYYYDYIDRVYPALAALSMQKYGEIIPYIQYVSMYFLQWRLLDIIPKWMTETETVSYREKIRNILLQIDDYIIQEQRNIYKEHKIFCLRLKYGDEIYSQFQLISRKFVFNNLVWCTTDNQAILNYWWHGMEADGTMRLTGEVNFPFSASSYEIFARDNLGNSYPLKFEPNMEENKQSLGQTYLTIRPFELCMPLEGVREIEFILRCQNTENSLFINTGKFSRLSHNPPESYCVIQNYIFSSTAKSIWITPASRATVRKYKRALWRGLLKRRDKRAIVCRVFASLLRKISGKQDIRISFGNDRIV